jgi:hypothetical protein
MTKKVSLYTQTHIHTRRLGCGVGDEIFLNLWGFNIIKNVETASTGSNFIIGL